MGQLLPGWPDSWKLQSRAGQRGSCDGHTVGDPEGGVLPRAGKENLRVFPILGPWPCPGCLWGFVEHSRETRAGCARAAALVAAPGSHSSSSSSLSKVWFWGSGQSLCSALVCPCCLRLPHPCTQPSPWSSTFCQCSGPWHFRKALAHKDNKSYLPECWHHLNLLFWKGVRVNSSSAQTQCSCPWWFSLSSLVINASSPCQHFWVDLYILEHFDLSAVNVSFCSSQGHVPADVKQSD